MLYLYHVIPLPCYTFTMLYLYHVIPLPCYTFTMLYLLPCYSFTILYLYHVIALPCYTHPPFYSFLSNSVLIPILCACAFTASMILRLHISSRCWSPTSIQNPSCCQRVITKP